MNSSTSRKLTSSAAFIMSISSMSSRKSSLARSIRSTASEMGLAFVFDLCLEIFIALAAPTEVDESGRDVSTEGGTGNIEAGRFGLSSAYLNVPAN